MTFGVLGFVVFGITGSFSGSQFQVVVRVIFKVKCSACVSGHNFGSKYLILKFFGFKKHLYLFQNYTAEQEESAVGSQRIDSYLQNAP